MARRRSEAAPGHPRYAVLRKLGSGGAGSVYLAQDLLQDRRQVALKVCRLDLEPEQLLREFRLLRELRHPAIARAFDFGRLPADGRTYFTLEYVPGRTLDSVSAPWRRRGLDREPGALDRFLNIFIQVCEALTYLHRSGLLHLDLKPANIVLSQGRVKLIDFGLFQSIHRLEARQPRGTALYSAPEVFAGGPLDRRADLYSLGVTFYRVATGRHPMAGRSLQELAERHRSRPPAPLRELPEGLARIILKLLAKSPRHRFQSGDELLEALRSLAREVSAAVPARALCPEPRFAGRKRELDAFFAWIQQLRGGRGAPLFVVEGGPGAGKTRFVEACVTELLGLGVEMLWASPDAGGKSHDGLRRMVESALVLHPLPRQRRSRFGFLFTVLGLASSASRRNEIAQLELEQIRSRVSREALELLRDAMPGPTVIVLEDLHRADPQLRDFVERLGQGAQSREASPPLGLLATSRPGLELAPRPQAERTKDAVNVPLGRLRQSEVAQALDTFHGLLPASVIRRLSAMSRGIPGLLVRLIQGCVRKAAHRPGSPAARVDLERLSAPGSSSLTLLLSEQVAALRPSSRAVALHLVLLGRAAGDRFLRDVTGLSRAELAEAHRELEQGGLLLGSRSGLYVDAEIVSGPILESSGPDKIRAAHARLGRRLLSERHCAHEAAHHLLRAGLEKEAIPRAQEAGAALESAGRVEEAASLYREALAHAASASPVARWELLEKLGDLEERSGKFDAAGECHDTLLADPVLPPGRRLRILRKRGGVHQRAGDGAAARRAYETALELVESTRDLDEHLHILYELAALHLYRGEFPRSTTFANRGLELLGSAGASALDPGARTLHALNLHSVAGHILLRQFEYERAAAEFSRSLKHAGRAGAPATTSLILNNLGIALHQMNRVPAALRVYRRAAALARMQGDDTTLFSIQCNVAAIRARQGEMRAASELLDAVEEMPPARLSRRARLFFVHSKGLVERIALRDARALWKEGSRLADALQDPLFAGYERLYLLENEIDHGRWGAARSLSKQLKRARGSDPHLARGLALRQAHLEALCGHDEAARSLLTEALAGRRPVQEARRQPHHAELWESVRAACARMELGDHHAAETGLEETRKCFARVKQAPGALECSLLLADLRLRRRDPAGARSWIREARRALARHNPGRGWRLAAVRIPLLEARAALQSPRGGRASIADRLVDAAGNLPPGSSCELGWLLDFVALEHGEPGARRRLEASRERFLRGLSPRDRRSYLARDHRARLGLEPAPAPRAREPAVPARPGGAAEKRLDALLGLRYARDLASALDLILEGLGARCGAIFLDARNPLTTWRGRRSRSANERERLREAALRAGSGTLRAGFCAEIRLAARRARLGVLYVEPQHAYQARKPEGELEGYLELAAQGLATLLGASREALDAAAGVATELLKTRTLVPGELVGGESERMQELLKLMERTRDSDLPVLLTGESGAGKDHVARRIHALSPRRQGPFVGQDCSAIPEGLLEADLFGHEAGAFTGARKARRGYLLAAEAGTFYLDNVDCMSLEVQAKLVRVIEQKEVRPVGGREPAKINVRFIASTRRDLKELCARGEFRNDLYFRLAGICLSIPPLREHAEDVPLLVQHFLQEIPGKAPALGSGALEALKAYSWPGNIRELESVVRRLALTAEGPVTHADVRRVLGLEGATPGFPRWVFEGRSYDEVLEEMKREYLLYLFDRFGGKLDLIARELGTTKRNVYLRFSQAGLRPTSLRSRGHA